MRGDVHTQSRYWRRPHLPPYPTSLWEPGGHISLIRPRTWGRHHRPKYICLAKLAPGADRCVKRACIAHVNAGVQAAPYPLQRLKLQRARAWPKTAKAQLDAKGNIHSPRKRPMVADPAPTPLPACVIPPPWMQRMKWETGLNRGSRGDKGARAPGRSRSPVPSNSTGGTALPIDRVPSRPPPKMWHAQVMSPKRSQRSEARFSLKPEEGIRPTAGLQPIG